MELNYLLVYLLTYSRYTARIVEIDETNKIVLVHFDGWNRRYDERIVMHSDRLRPPGRLVSSPGRMRKEMSAGGKSDSVKSTTSSTDYLVCRRRFALYAIFCMGSTLQHRRYAFCMVFHVRWIFLTTSLRILPESRSDEGGIQRQVVRNTSNMETIQNAFSPMLD